MAAQVEVTRRTFLRASAFAVGSVALAAACTGRADVDESGPGPTADPKATARKGSEPRPLSPPASFQEAPMLAARVKEGALPPVEERLPASPYVVPHRWLTTGKYGGHLRLVCGATNDNSIKEYMYGHSPLRWLNEGLDLGPGLVESWESNDDASEWTLHFRKGLKWSDGHPWSTEDIMFWWEDMVLNEEFGEGIPDEARSGTGTVAKLSAPDETTLVLSFDAPSPIVAEMIANWVNRGIGASWMEPKHYLARFHPKYNPDVSGDWTATFDRMRNPILNPDVPTMTGWRLVSYEEGSFSRWERNPYYWAVDREGNQLPYIDSLTFRVVDNVETRKLQIQNGQFDFIHGAFAGITLADVSGLRSTQSRHQMRIILWDSGSGTGSVFFFSQDYDDPAMRALIRTPKFRQALSLAFDRAEVRRSIYFDTGELTTGGYGPKTREFNRGDGPRMYKQWRESWVDYDPARARAMFDEIGCVDRDGDGYREKPDGSELVVRLEYPADLDPSGEHMRKNELLKKSWEAVGIKTVLSPVAPTSFADRWAQGKLMSTTAWECSTMSVAADMLWLMPMETTRWAPLQGQYYALRGTPDEHRQKDVDPYKRTPPRMEPDPGGPVDRLWKLAERVRVEPNPVVRDKLVWDMVKIHIDEGPFFMGAVANYPQVELVKEGLRNVPAREETALGGFVNDWHYPMPAAYDPETWYWDDPSSHAG